MEWRDKKQDVHQRADFTAIPRNFKRSIGSCGRALAIAKQPLGQRSKGQKCGSRVLAETRSERAMLDGIIKRDCSVEVIDCSIEVIATLDQIAGKHQRNTHDTVPNHERDWRSLFFGERQELRRKLSHGIPIERPSVRDPDAIEHYEQEQRVFGRLS
jgi:hypothetical protein